VEGKKVDVSRTARSPYPKANPKLYVSLSFSSSLSLSPLSLSSLSLFRKRVFYFSAIKRENGEVLVLVVGYTILKREWGFFLLCNQGERCCYCCCCCLRGVSAVRLAASGPLLIRERP